MLNFYNTYTSKEKIQTYNDLLLQYRADVNYQAWETKLLDESLELVASGMAPADLKLVSGISLKENDVPSFYKKVLRPRRIILNQVYNVDAGLSLSELITLYTEKTFSPASIRGMCRILALSSNQESKGLVRILGLPDIEDIDTADGLIKEEKQHVLGLLAHQGKLRIKDIEKYAGMLELIRSVAGSDSSKSLSHKIMSFLADLETERKMNYDSLRTLCVELKSSIHDENVLKVLRAVFQ